MEEKKSEERELMKKAADTVRCLSMDAVQKADSGHPGMPMGCADIAVVLWLKFMHYNPSDPIWPNRDRFVLSAGHGSMLIYSMLHLAGYDLPMGQIMQFRQWDSITPGHPEYGHTPGVETTTGPLGQGFANGVGMALAEQHLAKVFNHPDYPIVNHTVFGIVSDGDLMEGIASEAASLAGHLGLGRLVYIYDDNRITIEGETELAFTGEDVKKRFDAYGWHTVQIDGHDYDQIENALSEAVSLESRPSLIIARTHIALGSPNKQDTAASHGSPLGEEEVKAAREKLGFSDVEPFTAPAPVYRLFEERARHLKTVYDGWSEIFERYSGKFSAKAEEWKKYHAKPSRESLDMINIKFDKDKPVATRAASGKVLQNLASLVPQLIGGSSDLGPSNKTVLNDYNSISRHSFGGRNIHFGVREHAMAGIMNGMALHGGVIPYGGTFLVFSDYMRPSIRLAALMRLHLIYVLTHDSIFLGEDGPTHQPIEHVMSLRLIPGLTVIRPADATETEEAWKTALTRNGPVALILSRQKLPVIDRDVYPAQRGLSRGAYILAGSEEKPDILILATGSEVSTSLGARDILSEKGIKARIISFPSWELFEEQPDEYKNSILPEDMTVRLAVEAGRSIGWERYVGDRDCIHGIDRFGASAPASVLAEKYGMTPQSVAEHAERILERTEKA